MPNSLRCFTLAPFARVAVLGLGLGVAWAPAAAPAAESASAAAPAELSTEEDLQLPPSTFELKAQLDELERKLAQAQSLAVRRGVEVSVEGYADLGFYVPIGNEGVGVRQDIGN